MKRTLLLLVCLAPVLVHAQGEELENPGTVSAVQDRTYRMASELWIGIGVAPLDAFYKGITGQLGYVYHFTDSFAWQVGRGLLSYNIPTGLRNQLETQFGVNPTAFPQLNWILGSDVVWTPIYGKTSWLNSSVGHFEVYGSLGGSVVNERLGADVASGTGTTVFRPAVRLGVGARHLQQQDRVLADRLHQRLRPLPGPRAEHSPHPVRAGPQLRRHRMSPIRTQSATAAAVAFLLALPAHAQTPATPPPPAKAATAPAPAAPAPVQAASSPTQPPAARPPPLRLRRRRVRLRRSRRPALRLRRRAGLSPLLPETTSRRRSSTPAPSTPR